MNKLIGFILFFFCIQIVLSPEGAVSADRHGCEVCGMYIDQYQKTAGKLEYKDGRMVQSCGVACLLRLVEDAGGPDAFKSLMVKDWTVGIPVQAEEATYVISSKIIPDMLPNLIAFNDRNEALHFQEENGGELLTFSQALLVISPAAMTMPARIKTAVLPSKGASG
jgi:nitrous oxide reductase accessory protein NosL